MSENELRKRLESTIITKTFNVSGMPESVWKEVDEFCKTYYGDSRWTMIQDLVRQAKTDWKYAQLYDEIMKIKSQINELKEQISQNKSGITRKTFGGE